MLAHRQQGDEGVELRAVPHQLPDLVHIRADRRAPDERVAAADARVPRQHLEDGRLAGAVEAQQPEALACGHAQGHAVDRWRRATPVTLTT